MKKSTVAIIIVLVAAFLGFTGYTYMTKKAEDDQIKKVDEWSYADAADYNGNIADHLVGNKDAKVKVIEYADFQCPGCATTYPYIHEVAEEFGDKIAYIFRSYVLSYHPNGNAAASAANAAALQGYWTEYSKYLFSSQSEWEDAEGSKRDDLLAEYFTIATKGQGDISKFKEDMKSSAVKKKVEFDRKLANRVNLTSTPAIYINGEVMEVNSGENDFKNSLREKINAALEKAEK